MQKHWKSIFRPAFGVHNTQRLVNKTVIIIDTDELHNTAAAYHKIKCLDLSNICQNHFSDEITVIYSSVLVLGL